MGSGRDVKGGFQSLVGVDHMPHRTLLVLGGQENSSPRTEKKKEGKSR